MSDKESNSVERKSMKSDDRYEYHHRQSKHHSSKSKKRSTSSSPSRDRKTHKSSSYKHHRKHDKKRSSNHHHHERRSLSEERERKRHKRSKTERSEKHHPKSKKYDDKSRSSERHDTLQKTKISSEFDRSALVPIGPIADKVPSSKLHPQDDYFSYHNHLRLFLYRRDGTYFEDLTSSETHEAFEEFCNLYNSGKLESVYYNDANDLPSDALEQCKRTRHTWNFKTTDYEKKSLDAIKSGVKKQTEYNVRDGNMKDSQPVEKAFHDTQTPVSAVESTQKIDGNDRESFLKSMGITPGQKITIAPRND